MANLRLPIWQILLLTDLLAALTPSILLLWCLSTAIATFALLGAFVGLPLWQDILPWGVGGMMAAALMTAGMRRMLWGFSEVAS